MQNVYYSFKFSSDLMCRRLAVVMSSGDTKWLYVLAAFIEITELTKKPMCIKTDYRRIFSREAPTRREYSRPAVQLLHEGFSG